ncbi:glucose 1-dehydrogenase [Frankia sp. CcI49]|uniref:SDR family NAD(P)-dependent oxidoreductase n=1 Tax=Frankia sp. CcI49 TaxID=1745382 RepID=UPI000A051C95|nr:glucose 1-dehydrogenase [Frankia sp. CcI49]
MSTLTAPLFSYLDRRVLVVGGGRGIGRAVALALARAGADVAVAARGREQLDAVVAEIQALGRQAWALPVDLTEPGAPGDLVERALAALGRIDVLINSAGDTGRLERGTFNVTTDDFDHVFGLHVRAALMTSIRAAESMRDRGVAGAILTITSVGGCFPSPGAVLYGAAKAALNHLTSTLGMEFGTHGIRVNAIAPGPVETELIADRLTTAEDRAAMASFYPLNRIGHVDDVAAAALYLCSAEASWVSGVTLLLNGGQHASNGMFRWPRTHNPVPPGRHI